MGPLIEQFLNKIPRVWQADTGEGFILHNYNKVCMVSGEIKFRGYHRELSDKRNSLTSLCKKAGRQNASVR